MAPVAAFFSAFNHWSILAPPMVIISHIQCQKDFIILFAAGGIELFEVAEGVIFFDAVIEGFAVIVHSIIDVVMSGCVSGLGFRLQLWADFSEGVGIAVVGGADGIFVIPLFGFIGVFATGNGAKFALKCE